ncbi:MAG: hypothetical protein U0269_24765 [Polyangiales bacterium]
MQPPLRSLAPLVASLTLASPIALGQSAPQRSDAPCLSIQRRAATPAPLDGVATLVDDIVVEPRCEIALRQDAAQWVPVDPGARSFLALVAEAQGFAREQPRTFALVNLPHAIYARRIGAAPAAVRPDRERHGRRGRSAALAGAPGQSFVLLSRCVDTLGQRPSLEARVLPAARVCEGPLEVRATQSASCPAQLRVGAVELEANRDAQLAACAGGVSATYSIDAGSGRDPLRVIVGMVLARDAATPLQQHFRSLSASERAPTEPLFIARATAGLWGLAFNPRAERDLRAELRAAAAADELVFAQGDRALGTVILTGADEDESRARVPDAVFRAAMSAKYGPAGGSLSPTMREAREALSSLRVCLPGRYRARPSVIDRVSDRDACAPLARVLSADESALERDVAQRRLWAERTLWRVSVRGLEPIERERVEPVILRANEARPALGWVLSTGDRVGVEGDPRGLFLCRESGCAPLNESGQATLDESGLYELRAAPSLELARTAQATTLARWTAIDVLHDWVPVGLVTSRETLPGPLWMQLARDDDETFAWERRTHTLSSRVVFSERSVAVYARARAEASAESVLTSDVPVLASDTRRAGAPSGSALTVVLSRDERCPDVRAMDARAMATVEPDSLAPGSVFYAFLAQDQGPSRRLACVARARFRVRPRRTVAAVGPLTVGVLGDPRLAWFSPWENWGALGAIVPAIYTRASVGAWFSTELSVAAVSGFAPGRGAIDVVGPALVLDVRAAVLTVGAAMFVPRLSSDRAPVFSVAPFVALDVGSIYELAGGR